MSGEEAFARRLAMSSGARPPSPPSSPPIHRDDEDSIPGLSITSVASTETGEEAYLRRVALSKVQSSDSATQGHLSEVPPLPKEEDPPELAYNPFAPPSVPPPPGPPSSLYDDKIKAATAIAAKLGALGGTSAPSGPEEEVVSSKK
jgi:splicing factor 45